MRTWLNKLWCRLGLHGPYATSNEFFEGPRSLRTDVGFERRCPYCGTVWIGGQVYTRCGRTLGNWRVRP